MSCTIVLDDDRSMILRGDRAIEVRGPGYHRYLGPGRMVYVSGGDHEKDEGDRLLVLDVATGETIDLTETLGRAHRKDELQKMVREFLPG